MARPADVMFPKFAAKKNIGLCPFCSMPVDKSKLVSVLDKKENAKSGTCKGCMDNFFKDPVDEDLDDYDL